eukprot:scaffold74878_cov64-Phaeocystis_antarctica.AAC.3
MFKKGDINTLGEVTYSQNLQGCVLDHSTSPPICKGDKHVLGPPFKYGRFTAAVANGGSTFIPVAKFANGPHAEGTHWVREDHRQHLHHPVVPYGEPLQGADRHPLPLRQAGWALLPSLGGPCPRR